MTRENLQENAGLPARILWTLAIVAGITIANQYYNQPLLNPIRHDLGESGLRTNVITMMARTGYAISLLTTVTPQGSSRTTQRMRNIFRTMKAGDRKRMQGQTVLWMRGTPAGCIRENRTGRTAVQVQSYS